MAVGKPRVEVEPSLSRRSATVVRLGVAVTLALFALSPSIPHRYLHYALLVFIHPWLFRRALGLRLEPIHVVWVSLGVFLHPLGGAFGFYDSVWWWDHLTHVAAASLVAALAYVLASAYVRTESTAAVPAWTVPVAVLTVSLAAGLCWEGIELAHPELVVYGETDTALDAVFNVVGAALTLWLGPRVLDTLVDQLVPGGPSADVCGEDSGDTGLQPELPEESDPTQYSD
ncbi:hypothetical protein [Haloarchaeobius sp. TZWWS8]|uniref:hypothetical protein n=1 Tax=Haloarchaeobius sp. TZWWS8 TaxID=3446121 RepID=UPI003EB79FD5